MAMRRLPGKTSGVLDAALPPYSDEFVQDLHLLPFSPGENAGHRGCSVHLKTMIARRRALVKGICIPINFQKTLYKKRENGYHCLVYCKTRMRQDAVVSKRKESRSMVEFRTGGANRDHLSSGPAEAI